MAKILYFEDNKNIRNRVEDFLSDQHEIDAYGDPTYFLARQEKGEVSLSNYDILITDINMPYMEGIDFVKKHISDKGLEIPAIFMSLLCNNPKIKNSGIKNYALFEKETSLGLLEQKINDKKYESSLFFFKASIAFSLET